jgi:hypothetical protein
MKWPPYVMKLRVESPRHAFRLWLPLFLVIPVLLVFLLAVFLILLPFAFLALLFTWELGWWRPYLLGIPALYRLLCSLPGLKVDVGSREGSINIAIY